MEVLERVGTPEQKQRWLEPLLNGEIRSAFAMTEPDLASSDARNIACSAVLDGEEWVINGEKYYISGAGDPRCKIMIVMVRTNPEASAHLQQSQILVPLPHPGVEILGPMHVFGKDDAPHGHMHIRFTDVRVPKENILLGEGRGFEISQLRLGPAASTTACAPSARRRRRSSSWSSAASAGRRSASRSSPWAATPRSSPGPASRSRRCGSWCSRRPRRWT
jgi:alkylation response protein AidB-like acyl-CoA dehydrogenase